MTTRPERDLFEHVPVGLYRTTPDGTIIDANREFVEMLRYPSRESLLAIRAESLYLDPQDRERWQRLLRERGVVRQMETRLRRADGSELWVRESTRAERDAAGAVLHYEGLIEDITREKDARASARRGYELYRALVEHSSDLILELDRQRRILYASPSAKRLLGYEPEALRGRDAVEFIPPEESAGFVEAFERAASHPERGAELAEHQLVDASGARRVFESHGTAIRDAQGALRFVVTARDVTERRRGEELIQRSETRYRSLFEFAPLGIYLSDPGGAILAANTRLAEILGYASADEILRLTMQDLYLEPGERQALIARYEPLGEVVDLELHWKRKDGTPIWVQLSSHNVRDASGQTVAFEGFLRDISLRKFQEQRRQELEEQQTRLEQQLRQAQKMEAVGRLAGGVAHDFNNLLGVIIGYGELLRNRLPAGDQNRGRLEQILKAADRASGLTRQLLAFSRKQVLQPKILDLNLVVREMEQMLKRMIGEDVELVTRQADDLWRVRADPGQIEQVVMNLAVNARDAMPEGGRLSIATRNVERDGPGPGQESVMPPGRYALLEISDTGIGITREVLPHIFEPFFTTKEMGKGTGLGLSTVYGIVKQSGGYVWGASDPGLGTSFKIYLPGYEAPLENEAGGLPGQARRGRETLLVVEDEPMLRALLQETLEGEGYTVFTAENGAAAELLARTHSGSIELMISDVVMPGVSGRVLAERMALLRPAIRVLFVSGYTDDAIARHGVLEPGVDFLGKPFSPQQLAERVRGALDAAPAASHKTG